MVKFTHIQDDRAQMVDISSKGDVAREATASGKIYLRPETLAAIREGKVVRGGPVRIVREGAVVYNGKVATLKRFKDDAKEVEKGLECGMDFVEFKDFQKGDQLEFYVKETRTRRLSQSK